MASLLFDRAQAAKLIAGHVPRLHAKIVGMGPEAWQQIENELIELTKNAWVVEHGAQNDPKLLAQLTDDAAKQMVIDELALFGLRCCIATLPTKEQVMKKGNQG